MMLACHLNTLVGTRAPRSLWDLVRLTWYSYVKRKWLNDPDSLK
jgi:hypothetical protein